MTGIAYGTRSRFSEKVFPIFIVASSAPVHLLARLIHA